MSENKEYNPWKRTENEDLQVLSALDNTTEEQLAGFIDELLEIANKKEDDVA